MLIIRCFDILITKSGYIEINRITISYENGRKNAQIGNAWGQIDLIEQQKENKARLII